MFSATPLWENLTQRRKGAKAQKEIDARYSFKTLDGFLCVFAPLREISSFPKVEGERRVTPRPWLHIPPPFRSFVFS